MGYGGIIASGIAGALAGVGQAGYEDVVEREKNAALEQRAAMLARLREEQDIRAEDRKIANMPRVATATAAAEKAAWESGGSEIFSAKEKAKAAADASKPYTLNPSDTRVTPGVGGEPDKQYTAPERPGAAEDRRRQAAESAARIKEINARVAQIGKDNGIKKEDLPQLFETEEDGKKVTRDRHSEAVARKDKNGNEVWMIGDKVLPNGLASLKKYQHLRDLTDSIDLPGIGKPTMKSESGENVREVSGKIGGAKASPVLVPGQVKNGFRFKGGDSKKKENWESI